MRVAAAQEVGVEGVQGVRPRPCGSPRRAPDRPPGRRTCAGGPRSATARGRGSPRSARGRAGRRRRRALPGSPGHPAPWVLVSPDVMDPTLRAAAEAARGFMPPDEGVALHDAAAAVGVDGPLLEVGQLLRQVRRVPRRRGRRVAGTVLFAVDHHRGSEENQPGWEFHEPDLVDPDVGRIDTLPRFRRTIFDAGLEAHVVAVVGDSPTVARHWSTPLAFLFIDGGHGREPAHADYDRWVPHVPPGRHPGDPRRLPRPRRRRPAALRAVPAGAVRRLRPRLHHRLPPGPAPHRRPDSGSGAGFVP